MCEELLTRARLFRLIALATDARVCAFNLRVAIIAEYFTLPIDIKRGGAPTVVAFCHGSVANECFFCFGAIKTEATTIGHDKKHRVSAGPSVRVSKTAGEIKTSEHFLFPL